MLYVLSKENVALAQAEVERLLDEKGTVTGNLLDIPSETLPDGLAFTREIHQPLFETTKEAIEKRSLEHPWHEHVESPFAVDARGLYEEKKLAAPIWRSLDAAGKKPSVDLDLPTTTICLLELNKKLVVTKLLWSNHDRFFDRRPHLRPRNHPTGLNPKLARAMVNLAGPAKEILDPFCGAGGILLEGSLTGRGMTGLDIDAEQILRSKENLAHYAATATLTVGDATGCDELGIFDAIVTDLPLGKNAILKEAETTFAAFFEAASRTTKVMVVAIDTSFALERCFGPWKERMSFDWPIHKGMTKRIFVLEH